MPRKKNLTPTLEPLPPQVLPSPATGGNFGLFKSKSLFVVSGVVVLSLAVCGGLGLQNHRLHSQQLLAQSQLREAENKLKNYSSSGTPVAEDLQQIVEAVGKLVVLPPNEQPTVATVADLSKLKGQPFFDLAQVGDKVLIYAQAKKAILYRATENKVIEIAPLNVDSASSNVLGASTENRLAVEVRNGSGKSGVAGQTKTQLQKNGDFSVTKVGNAHAAYPKTILYVANPNKLPEQVSSLLQKTGADLVSSLPAGEPTSTADAVLILGQQ